MGLANENFGGQLRIARLDKWVQQGCDSLVTQELPDSVAGQDNYLVLRLEVVLPYFWYGVDTNFPCDCISKAS